MKRIIIVVALIIGGILPAHKAAAQADEIAQLLLNIEKLAQFKKILKNMKEGYEILNGGYNTVKNIAEGNYSLHKAFLDGLLQVSPTVRNYKRIPDIINYQRLLINEYQKAYDRFKRSNNFTAQELQYLSRVYNNLLKSSLRNLEELTGIITAGKMRMSDDDRLLAIDRIYADMSDKLIFLRHFNNNTSLLALQRAKDKNDTETMRNAHGLKK